MQDLFSHIHLLGGDENRSVFEPQDATIHPTSRSIDFPVRPFTCETVGPNSNTSPD